MIEMENFTYLLPARLSRGLLLLLACFFVCSGLIAQEKPLQVKANTIESSCAGEGHVISLQAKGGEGPYTYTWQDGIKGNFRKDLASGTYVCVVKDAKGKSVSKQFNFDPKPAALELDYTQEKAQNGSATLSLQVKGGKAPYRFVWIGQGIDMQAAQNSKVITNLGKGEYQAVVQDANQCTASVTINVK